MSRVGKGIKNMKMTDEQEAYIWGLLTQVESGVLSVKKMYELMSKKLGISEKEANETVLEMDRKLAEEVSEAIENETK